MSFWILYLSLLIFLSNMVMRIWWRHAIFEDNPGTRSCFEVDSSLTGDEEALQGSRADILTTGRGQVKRACYYLLYKKEGYVWIRAPELIILLIIIGVGVGIAKLVGMGGGAAQKVCTQCYTVVTPKTITRGSFAIEIILWLCFWVPVLIYSFWRMTTRGEGCPLWGGMVLVPVESPRGKEIISGRSAGETTKLSEFTEKILPKLRGKKKEPQ
jgi:hypothetical protein